MGCLGGAANLNDLARSNHHFEVTAGGVLEDECRDLIQAFFRLKRTGTGTRLNRAAQGVIIGQGS